MAIDSKKIVKNTVYLYLRMVITMLITIFSSRIVLNSLGIDGFGTYNIILGVVVLFYFIQSALNTSTLKFLSSCIVEYDTEGQIKIFNSSLQTTIILSTLVLLLLETVGLYIVLNVLKIDAQYRQMANISYQIIIVTYIIQLVRIPYTSMIVSFEKMSFYAIISIVESVLKFVAALLLLIGGSKKIVLYCIYIFLATFICTVSSIIFCKKKFNNCKINLSININSLKNIGFYSGWTTLSSLSNSLAQQGGNILMNIYYGVVANAAWGIAHQVNTAFSSLASSLQMAFNPQINKSFAQNDLDNLKLLVYRASYLSYYMILLIGIPIICHIQFVLFFWLKTPPEYSFSFCVWIILFQMIDTLQGPFNILLYASGRIKFYNIWLSSILLLNIVISAILLNKGFSPVCVPVTMVILNIVTGVIRLLHIQYILKINLNKFYSIYLFRMILTTLLGYGISYYIAIGSNNYINEFALILINLIILFAIIIFIGIPRYERIRVLDMIKHKISKL